MHKTVVSYVGWTLFMVSVSVFAWNADQLGALAGTGDGGFASLARLVAFSVGFLAAVPLAACIERRPRAFAAASALLTVLGWALLAMAGPAPACLYAGSVALGLGEALLFCLWQLEFVSFGALSACRGLAIASAVAALLFLALSHLSYLGSPVACSALTALASAAFFVALPAASLPVPRADVRPEVSPGAPKQPCRPESAPSPAFPWRSVACVAASGFIWQVVFALGSMDEGLASALGGSFVFAQLLATAALLALCARRRQLPRVELVFQVLFPILATGFLVMPFLGGTYRAVFAGVLVFSFGTFSILMQVVCIEKAEQGASPLRVFGLFAGIVYACMTAGFAVGLTLRDGSEFGMVHLLVLALVLTYLLAAVLFVLRVRPQRDAGSPGDSSARVDGLEEGLRRVSQEAGLSARELEVLGYLVRGRDLPYIAEALSLSKNTVRTHTSNAYRKLGVHSKQELIDLVERGPREGL